MKPIYLELAGWGPYKNKEVVDFEKLGGKVVKVVFLMELTDLGGRKRLEGYDVASVVQYEGE